MKARAIFGWFIIILLGLSPAILWFFFRPTYDNMASYDYITHSIGQLTALIGVSLFALSFMLSSRLKFIEDIFGGLDKVYIVHGIVGGSALILLLMHPIFLVLKFIPADFKQAAEYLLPSGFISVDLGIIALLSLAILIAVTLYSRIKYNRWKFSHEFLGFVFLIAVFHIFLVTIDATRDYIFKGYLIFATVVSFIGLGFFIYSLIFRRLKMAEYNVESVRRIKDVFEIIMKPVRNGINFKAGQFIFVKFYCKGLSTESHPFSVASETGSKTIRILPKALGDYTYHLSKVKPGTKAQIEGPYGRFKSLPNTDMIWIAGGIGITPFLGMAKDLDGTNNVDLYYSVKEEDEFIGLDELKSVEMKMSNGAKRFRLIPWVSNKNGFLGISDIQKISGEMTGKEFFLCGPSAMKEALAKALMTKGVDQYLIHDEEFRFK